MKFNQRGQSALEYLMTYGWALVVIVVVIAALVLLVGNPSSASDRCTSPASGISVKNAEMGTDGWQLIVTNLTGKTVSSMTLTETDDTPDATALATYTIAGSLNPGAELTITPNAVGDYTATTAYQSTLTFAYNDGLAHSVSFTCNGTA